eukprot:1160827-Pelagomonas_calceolata.AAC.13
MPWLSEKSFMSKHAVQAAPSEGWVGRGHLEATPLDSYTSWRSLLPLTWQSQYFYHLFPTFRRPLLPLSSTISFYIFYCFHFYHVRQSLVGLAIGVGAGCRASPECMLAAVLERRTLRQSPWQQNAPVHLIKKAGLAHTLPANCVITESGA